MGFWGSAELSLGNTVVAWTFLGFLFLLQSDKFHINYVLQIEAQLLDRVINSSTTDDGEKIKVVGFAAPKRENLYWKNSLKLLHCYQFIINSLSVSTFTDAALISHSSHSHFVSQKNVHCSFLRSFA